MSPVPSLKSLQPMYMPPDPSGTDMLWSRRGRARPASASGRARHAELRLELGAGRRRPVMGLPDRARARELRARRDDVAGAGSGGKNESKRAGEQGKNGVTWALAVHEDPPGPTSFQEAGRLDKGNREESVLEPARAGFLRGFGWRMAPRPVDDRAGGLRSGLDADQASGRTARLPRPRRGGRRPRPARPGTS